MTIEVKVPVLPESVSDATIASWHKKPGDAVKRDENLVDLETDKVVLEVPAPVDGVLKEIKQDTGATVTSQQLLAVIGGHTSGRGLGELGFDRRPRFEDLDDFRDAVGQYDHALARHDLDQPFQFQPLQRLVHGGSADLQQTRYGGLVEILAGQEIERDDLLLDVLIGLGDQGAVLDRRLAERVIFAHGVGA